MKKLCALALATLLPGIAWAGSEMDPNIRLDFVLGGSSGGGSNFVLSPMLHIYSPSEHVALSIDWGVTKVFVDDEDTSSTDSFNVLNPTLGVLGKYDTPSMRLRGGLGVGIPMAKSDWEHWMVNEMTAATVGVWNYWMYAPNFATILLPMRLEAAIGERLYLATEGAAYLMIPTKDTGLTAYGLQLAAQAMLPTSLVDVGLRLQGVFIATRENTNFQGSGGPILKLKLGTGFIEGMLVINIDEPYGLSFTDGSAFGARIGAGLSF